MGSLDEIIEILSDGSDTLTNALLKTKIVLFRIGKKELATWVNYEINGYPNNSLPDYRIVPSRILLNANNGARSYKGIPPPLNHLDEDKYIDATEARVRMPIGQIEEIVNSSDQASDLAQEIPLEIAYNFYAHSIEKSYEITRCYKEISRYCFVGILTQVRSRLLDFLLEVTEQANDIQGNEAIEEKMKKVDTSSLFNSAIFGDNTTINLGNNNSFDITNSIKKGDYHALKSYLEKEGVSNSDINELKIAIDKDGPISIKEKSYGNHVSTWFSKMIQKASSSTWAVGVAVATDVLSNALKKYYGFER